MREWVKILVHPLGLSGFTLFLVFGLFAKLKQRNERRWLFPAAIAMAFISLVGGLTLAYLQTPQMPAAVASPSKPAAMPGSVQQQNNQVQQTSSGPGSPNVQGVQGDVTITVDQSSGKVPRDTAKQNTTKDKQK